MTFELLWGPGGVVPDARLFFQGPRFSWAVSRRLDGAQKLGLPLDWSHKLPNLT